MAGPGTGKSHTFGEIIKSSMYKDKKILVLSFINNLVDDLAKDFEGFNNVKVKTLHSFALQTLNSNQNISLNQEVDDVLSKDFYIIKEGTCNYVKKFQSDTLESGEMDFYRERKMFYEKKDKKLHSFDSIVYAWNEFFKDNKEKIPVYDLILVDEFQDFNHLECKMIELLAEKNRMVLVGDDYQALYGFKSATSQLIRDYYNDSKTESFTLPDCYRCTKVIVDAVNDVIKNAKEKGFLRDKVKKEYNYPCRENKDEISRMYSCMEYKQGVAGKQLFYFLAEKIRKDVDSVDRDKRILILAPKYMIHQLAEGVIRKGLNVVKVELLKKQKKAVMTILAAFKVLKKTKTDNFSLRCVLHKYIDDKQISNVVKQSHKNDKGIWSLLDGETKKKIENDIDLYKKCTGLRDSQITKQKEKFIRGFDINIPIKIVIDGIGSISKGAIEVEIVTPMSSKGLSADYVYYLVNDEHTLEAIDGRKQLTDTKVCEFLVGITRAKEKLTFVSTKNKTPEVLKLIDEGKIKKI